MGNPYKEFIIARPEITVIKTKFYLKLETTDKHDSNVSMIDTVYNKKKLEKKNISEFFDLFC